MSDEKVNRRWVLMSIGVLLNGAVALLIATPLVGYLLGPIRKNGGYNSWIDLGELAAVQWFCDAIPAESVFARIRYQARRAPRYYQVALLVRFNRVVPNVPYQEIRTAASAVHPK